VEYRCYCSRERIQSALLSAGAAELADMADSGEDTIVICHFCDHVYRFSPEEVRAVMSRA